MAGLPPIKAYGEPGMLDRASDDRRAVAELAAEMAPAEVGELLAPMVAPWPCDLDLAREYVLEGADPSAGPSSTPCRAPSTPWPPAWSTPSSRASTG